MEPIKNSFEVEVGINNTRLSIPFIWNFSLRLSNRYGVVLNFLAEVEAASWTQIKATLEAHEHRSLPNPTIADTLNKLIKNRLITKNDGGYSIVHQLIAYGISQDPFQHDE